MFLESFANDSGVIKVLLRSRFRWIYFRFLAFIFLMSVIVKSYILRDDISIVGGDLLLNFLENLRYSFKRHDFKFELKITLTRLNRDQLIILRKSCASIK